VSLVPKDSLFDSQWLRTKGHASSGGAEVAECFTAARQIRAAVPESWIQAVLCDLGAGVLSQAHKSVANGHRARALAVYLRASNYFRAAYPLSDWRTG
jgi:hypothetical protein